MLLTAEEIELLALLHEHAAGFDKAASIPVGLIVERMYAAQDHLPRALAFLEGIGHIGFVKASGSIESVWLTLKGEQVVRGLESALIREDGRDPGVALTYSFLESAGIGVKDRIIARVQRFLAGAKASTPERT